MTILDEAREAARAPGDMPDFRHQTRDGLGLWRQPFESRGIRQVVMCLWFAVIAIAWAGVGGCEPARTDHFLAIAAALTGGGIGLGAVLLLWACRDHLIALRLAQPNQLAPQVPPPLPPV